tara:strand:- start:307 stop:546 length:240 start_codon:yes stop_codon:yes gene_type:complete
MGETIPETQSKVSEKEYMENLQMIEYLMYTPIEKLPAIPSSIESKNNHELGKNILSLLENNTIKITGMNKNGLLQITTV